MGDGRPWYQKKVAGHCSESNCRSLSKITLDKSKKRSCPDHPSEKWVYSTTCYVYYGGKPGKETINRWIISGNGYSRYCSFSESQLPPKRGWKVDKYLGAKGSSPKLEYMYYRCTACKHTGSKNTKDGKCPKRKSDKCDGDWGYNRRRLASSETRMPDHPRRLKSRAELLAERFARHLASVARY